MKESDRDKLLNKFGENLKAARLKAGLSQENLANIVGLDRTYIGSVERGERNISLVNIVRLSKVLDIEPSAFFSGL